MHLQSNEGKLSLNQNILEMPIMRAPRKAGVVQVDNPP